MDNSQIPTPNQQQKAFPDIPETKDVPETSDISQTPKTPEIPKKAKFVKALLCPKVLFPIILACIVIIVSAIVVSANTDKAITEGAFSNMFDRIADNEVYSMFEKGMEKGKFVIKLGEDSDLLTVPDPDTQEPVNLPVEITMELWSTTDKAVLRLSALNSDLTAYASTEGIWASSNILSDSYGLSFKTLMKKMEDSDLYAEYIEPYLEANGYQDLYDLYSNMVENNKKLSKDAEKLTEKYLAFFKEELWENGESEKTSESGDSIVTLTLDERSISETLRAFFEKAAKDKSLQKFLDTYADVELLGLDDYSNWKEIFKDPDIVEDACDALEAVDFKIKVEITASGILHNMKNLKISYILDEGKLVANINMAEKDAVSAKLTVVSDGETETIGAFKYSTSKEGFKFSLEANGAQVIKINFVKKDDSKYKMTLGIIVDENEQEVVVTGKYENNKKHLLFTLDKISAEEDGETIEKTLDLTFECIYNEKLPAFPKDSKDVLELTEEDIEAIKNELQEWADEIQNDEELSGILKPLFGSSDTVTKGDAKSK